MTRRSRLRSGWQVAVASVVLAVAVVTASCGSEEGAADTETTRTGDGAAESSVADPVLGADLQVTTLHRSEPTASSLKELVAASEDIVVGVVSSAESLGTPDAGEDPNPSEYFRVEVAPDEVLKGDGPVSVVWEGFITDGQGNRELRIEHDGISMPDVGDRLLLFLVPMPPGGEKLFGGGLSIVNTLDGIYYVEADQTIRSRLEGDGRIATRISGKPLSDVTAEIRSAAEGQ